MLFAGRDGAGVRVEIVPRRVGTLAITEASRNRLMRDKMLSDLKRLRYTDSEISRAFGLDRRNIARRVEQFRELTEAVGRAE